MNQLQSTNSPQTSVPPPSEQYETVDAICGSHGPYQARIIPAMFDGMKARQIGCPQCAAEHRAEAEAKREREAEAQRRRVVAQLRADSGIPARFADRTFAGYAATGQGQKIALGVCRAFAESWPEKRAAGASLVLTGGPGTGKTHLACAVGNHVMAEHLGAVHFATVATLLRGIKDTYRKDSTASEQDAINALLRPALLIVDEVGVQVGSEHEKLLMFEVLNLRYQELAPTILISNLNASEIENFLGQRVMDRYRECGSVLAFDWDSYRGRA